MTQQFTVLMFGFGFCSELYSSFSESVLCNLPARKDIPRWAVLRALRVQQCTAFFLVLVPVI